MDESSLELQANCIIEMQNKASRGDKNRPKAINLYSPCVLEIIIYGPPILSENIGSFLRQFDIRLQEPVGSIRNVRYLNPHQTSVVDLNSIKTTNEFSKPLPNETKGICTDPYTFARKSAFSSFNNLLVISQANIYYSARNASLSSVDAAISYSQFYARSSI